MKQRARITVGLLLGLIIVMGGMPSVSEAQTTTRVSMATGGGQGIGGSSRTAALSADGRIVAFESHATNLIPGDTNGMPDIFVHDRGSAVVSSSSGTDLDGGGNADIVWRKTTSRVVAIWLMNGATLASSGFLGGVPFEWQIAGVGDVNGDGKADVIWRNSTSGVVAVWLMNGLTIMSVGFPGSTSTDWEIQ